MTHWYELTVMARTDEPKSEVTFQIVADAVGRGLDAKVMHRVTEVGEDEVPIPLRDSVPFEEVDDGV